MQYDVAIVGAGIAGTFAANKLSKAGLTVIVLEREKNASTSFCGEMTGKETLKRLKLSSKSDQVTTSYRKSTVVFLDNNFEISVPQSQIKLYLVEIQDVKKSLIEEAVSNGTKTKFNTPVKTVIKEKGKVVGVKTKSQTIKSDVVIGADGAKSIVAMTAGFPSKSYKTLPSFRYKYKNANIKNDKEARFYIGKEIGLGYLWAYPRNKKEVNVGIGAINNPHMTKVFTNFVDNMDGLKKAKVYAKGGDMIPYSGVLSQIAKKGVALVGDAAGQVDALLGGGVHSSTKAADMLVPCIIETVENQNPSLLLNYDTNYQASEEAKRLNKTAATLKSLLKLHKKKVLFDLLEEIQSTLSSNVLKKMATGKLNHLHILEYFLKHPVLSYRIIKETKF